MGIKPGTKMPYTNTSKSGKKLSILRCGGKGKASYFFVLDEDCKTIKNSGYGYNDSKICVKTNAIPVHRKTLFDLMEEDTA